MDRRHALAGMAAMALTGTGRAQTSPFPTKPVRIVVPFNAGSGADSTARTYGEIMSRMLGQPVVVENRPGASANIGTEVVARAPADGYTVLVTAPNFATS